MEKSLNEEMSYISYMQEPSGPIIPANGGGLPMGAMMPLGTTLSKEQVDLGMYMMPIVGTALSIRDAINDPTAGNIAIAGISGVLDAVSFGALGNLLKAVGKTAKAGKAVKSTYQVANATIDAYTKAPSFKTILKLQTEAAAAEARANKIRRVAPATLPEYQTMTDVINRLRMVNNAISNAESKAAAKRAAVQAAKDKRSAARGIAESADTQWRLAQDTQRAAQQSARENRNFLLFDTALYPAAKTEAWTLNHGGS